MKRSSVMANSSYIQNLTISWINFKVNKGDYLCVLGENGAGKSTILKMIMGEMPLDSGDVILAKGKSINKFADALEGSPLVIRKFIDELEYEKAHPELNL